MPPSTPTLFPDAAASSDPVTAHCDGGSRGNPGPAGFGAQITDAQGRVLAELSEFLGIRTNNYAEYSGLLASLQYALDHNLRRLRVISDSELMVKQIQGKYKVNSPDLKPLWQEARNRIAKLDRFEITHALRHKNKDADRLANEAMDRGMKRGSHSSERGTPAERQPPSKPPAPPPERTPPAPDLGRSAPARAPERNPPARGPERSEEPASLPGTPTPAMLRGFARNGAIHILGPHTLPDGTFVKIIPE